MSALSPFWPHWSIHVRHVPEHCHNGFNYFLFSDGTGRTGTYILIDMVLNRMTKGAKEIDIAATLEHIRDQRMAMVKTKSQFEYVLTAVAEEVQAILKALAQNWITNTPQNKHPMNRVLPKIVYFCENYFKTFLFSIIWWKTFNIFLSLSLFPTFNSDWFSTIHVLSLCDLYINAHIMFYEKFIGFHVSYVNRMRQTHI